MGPIACAAVRHSEGNGLLAQEEDLGAMETSWDTLRFASRELSTVGKARAVVMSSASAGTARCENMALTLVPALAPALTLEM